MNTQKSTLGCDLTTQEQNNVRVALRYLRLRFGGWLPLSKALRFKDTTLANAANGRVVTAALAFRIARLVDVGVDDLLGGKFPVPGVCPYCNHDASAGAS